MTDQINSHRKDLINLINECDTLTDAIDQIDRYRDDDDAYKVYRTIEDAMFTHKVQQNGSVASHILELLDEPMPEKLDRPCTIKDYLFGRVVDYAVCKDGTTIVFIDD